MHTLNNILKLLDESGRSQKELADYLGLSKNIITEWKQGRVRSYTKYLPQIANFFGVTVDKLFESPQASSVNIHNSGIIGDHNSNCCNTAEPALGEIEREIVSLCGKMTMQQKNALLTRAYELLENK